MSIHFVGMNKKVGPGFVMSWCFSNKNWAFLFWPFGRFFLFFFSLSLGKPIRKGNFRYIFNHENWRTTSQRLSIRRKWRYGQLTVCTYNVGLTSLNGSFDKIIWPYRGHHIIIIIVIFLLLAVVITIINTSYSSFSWFSCSAYHLLISLKKI